MTLFTVPDGDSSFELSVWYPALNPDSQPEETIYTITQSHLIYTWLPAGEQPTIYGHALQDAAPDVEHGPYPLVIYSHGLANWPYGMAYLAEHLASQGFVVVAPQHRGETPDEFWQGAYYRPVEVRLSINYADTLTAEGGALAGIIDTDKIAVVGGSSGGWTALIGGGAQMHLGLCATPPEPGLEAAYGNCSQFLPNQDKIAEMFGLEAAPEELWPAYYDERVDAIVTMVPDGDIWGPNREGVTGVAVPTLVITASQDAWNVPEFAAYPIYEHLGSQNKALVVFENGFHTVGYGQCSTMPWLLDIDLYWLCADWVWDQARSNDLHDHFTTAFLLDVLKGDEAAHAALLAENVSFPGIRYETTMK